mmetsp:Transcript_122972/g.393043  ORF Transcript_122972/g.393043 Transcript_122972/m.393043 type:complete len:202 (-) Transcript_122972:22-627(-)
MPRFPDLHLSHGKVGLHVLKRGCEFGDFDGNPILEPFSRQIVQYSTNVEDFVGSDTNASIETLTLFCPNSLRELPEIRIATQEELEITTCHLRGLDGALERNDVREDQRRDDSESDKQAFDDFGVLDIPGQPLLLLFLLLGGILVGCLHAAIPSRHGDLGLDYIREAMRTQCLTLPLLQESCHCCDVRPASSPTLRRRVTA